MVRVTLRPGRPLIRPPPALSVLLAAALHGTLVAQPPDSLPDPGRDAYLDETARRLVLGAKAARDTARLGIDSYTALIRERVGIEAPSFRRDRPWVSGERAIRVRWSRREPAVAHVLGARFRHPGTAPGDSEFFTGLRTERFAADPLGVRAPEVDQGEAELLEQRHGGVETSHHPLPADHQHA